RTSITCLLFFQAEDGIRDPLVTGVQTCALPILPGDITGFSVFNQKTREFEFQPGPVFADVLLADEINRTTPRTQSALLEAMQERDSEERRVGKECRGRVVQVE